jgi:hypothetical protein
VFANEGATSGEKSVSADIGQSSSSVSFSSLKDSEDFSTNVLETSDISPSKDEFDDISPSVSGDDNGDMPDENAVCIFGGYDDIGDIPGEDADGVLDGLNE